MPLTAEEIELYAIDIPECLRSIAMDIPEYYHDYMDRFDGEKATTTLPDFQPDSDFTINLDPSKPLPKPSQPYHMNQEECAECRKVLNEMLNASWAEPADSNCPIATLMFFVWKKDGTRHPVIDYCKLNDITIKDSYPLLRIDEMMDCIHGSEIFMKFDLKSGYNQVCICVTPRALHDLIPIFSFIQFTIPTHWNLIEPTPITITHIPSVRRNYGEVKCGLMIPAGYIGSRVYTADTMTHYSTLPTVFYFSERAPLYISYSSLLFKPPCISSYFSSFQIELRTGPLLIPNRLPKGLTLFQSSSYSYQFLRHRLRYHTQEIHQIPKMYNSD